MENTESNFTLDQESFDEAAKDVQASNVGDGSSLENNVKNAVYQQLMGAPEGMKNFSDEEIDQRLEDLKEQIPSRDVEGIIKMQLNALRARLGPEGVVDTQTIRALLEEAGVTAVQEGELHGAVLTAQQEMRNLGQLSNLGGNVAGAEKDTVITATSKEKGADVAFTSTTDGSMDVTATTAERNPMDIPGVKEAGRDKLAAINAAGKRNTIEVAATPTGVSMKETTPGNAAVIPGMNQDKGIV